MPQKEARNAARDIYRDEPVLRAIVDGIHGCAIEQVRNEIEGFCDSAIEDVVADCRDPAQAPAGRNAACMKIERASGRGIPHVVTRNLRNRDGLLKTDFKQPLGNGYEATAAVPVTGLVMTAAAIVTKTIWIRRLKVMSPAETK